MAGQTAGRLGHHRQVGEFGGSYLRNWCQQAAAAAAHGLVVVFAMLMWLGAAGGAAAQPVITDVDAYDYQGAEILQFGGGTFVTITGSGFTGATDVRFGGVPGNFLLSVVDDNTIRTMSPAGPFGTSVSVTVETPLGTSAPSSTLLTYGNSYQTAVGSVTPAAGPAAGGTTVTILGSWFTGASKVEFGSTLATNVVVVDNSTITATVPAGTGTVDIFVTPPHGDAYCACGMGGDPPATYTYIPAPVITDLWGVAFHGGEELIQFNGSSPVTIIGSGFTGATAVHFGGVPSVVFLEVVDDTRIRTYAPSGTFGTSVSVTVTTPGGTSAPSSKLLKYSSTRQPGIATVTPASGPAAGGTTVTLTGIAFSAASKVTFGTTPATSYAVVDDTTITAVAPAGVGTVDVFVTNVIGVANCACGYGGNPAPKFSYIPVPTITDVTAFSFAGAELLQFDDTEPVTITGAGFTDATTVLFGGVPSAGGLTVVDDTRITTRAPSGTLGTSVSVTVTTPGGTSAPSTQLLTYSSMYQPSVGSVTPASGPAAGGTAVTITGSHFSGASAVSFGTTPATSFAVVDSQTVTAVAPPGVGTVDIFVSNAIGVANCVCGMGGNPAPKFTYIPGPVVAKLVRNGGSTVGGDTVVLTGSSFTGATAVSFGGTAAASFTIDGATQITAVTPPGSGNVNVRVVSPGGTSSTGPENLYYYGAPPPVLTAVTPASGPEAGGTSVSITGSGFSGASNVLFGATPATSFSVDSDTAITAISPPGTGTVDIFVDAPCCTNAPNGSFTYI
ncbi:IPT/TIG domain-containing protein, partial [Devosia insulae]|uniref:IPT/TIG domain-containing protein n=1 Tax=Devosia insulae TaxID=408174 RepID=UPI00159F2391